MKTFQPNPCVDRAIVMALLLCGALPDRNAAAAAPPFITTQPTNQTVQAGGNATFAVQASSSTTLNYQWYFQSNAIPGATSSSYTRTNAQLLHAGPYYVGVTNADGGLFSTNAILNVTGTMLSGTVFEDVSYSGGAGRTMAESSGVGVAGARVEVYSAAGDFITFADTGPDGGYTLAVAPQASYILRVVNGSVRSSRPGYTSTLLPVQTFRMDATSGIPGPVNDRVGGQIPTLTDPGDGSTTLAALTVGSNTPQSITTVTVTTNDISGLDFGFNFNTIVNTNNAGQGSLRQFILNANALSGADRTQFMISDGAAHPGLRAGLANQLTGPVGSQVARVIPATALPVITDALTVIDATTQTANVGNHNSAVLGTGGTVGVDGLPLSQVAGPEVEIRDSGSLVNGLEIQADNVTVRGFSIYGFGAVDGQGAIVIGNSYKNTLVENNLLGSAATAIADPGPTLRNWHGVYSAGADSGSIRSNLFCFTGRIAVYLGFTSTNWTVVGNEIRDTGTETTDGDGITLNASPSNTIAGNLITGSSSQGITVTGAGSAGNVFVNNTVRGNGVGTTGGLSQSTAITIRSTGGASLFDRNVVTANHGAGLAVNNGATGIRLTRNSFFDNGTVTNRSGGAVTGQIGIDLNSSTDNANVGTSPFVSINDLNDADGGGNNLLNFPVMDTATLTNGNLLLTGWARPGSAMEFFLADGDSRGFGEGRTYLVTLTEGSGADLDGTASSYGPGLINGLAQGADNTSRFRFSIPAPVEVAAGDLLTATATDASGNTSEFGGVVTVGPAADVATTIGGPASVYAGADFTYTITVTNGGPSTASNILVNDTLPAGIKVVGISGGGTLVGVGPGQVVFDSASSNFVSGNLLSGGLTWSHVTTTAPNRLLLAGVSLGDFRSSSNPSVASITYGGLTLSKVTAINNGVVRSEVWQLVDPPSGTNTIAITLVGTPTTLVAGASTFTGVDPVTPLSEVVSSLGPRSNGSSITIGSATNEIVFDNIAVDKFFPPNAAAGQTQLWSNGIYYEAGAASIKPGTNSVTMAWNIQNAGWAAIAASVKAAPSSGVVNWTIPMLAAGAATNLTITVTAPLGGTLTNTVASTSETADSKPGNNDGSTAGAWVTTTVIPVADLVIAQTGPTSVPPLTNYTYTVTVSNQGPSTASNVVVTDTVDPRLTFVSASGGGSYLGGVVTWPALPGLSRGAWANHTVTVQAPISGSLTNRAAATSAAFDPNAANNDGSAPASRVVTVVSPLQVANTSRGASVQTLNWNHTISPGSSRILVVGVSIDAPNSTVLAATFGGLLPLTPLGQTNSAQTKVAMYYLLNPPVGTYPISINLNTASGIVGGAVSFIGINQTTPIAGFAANIGSSTNASLSLASSAGGVVVDTVAPKSPQSVTTNSAAQNLQWNLFAANYSGAGSTMPGATVASPAYDLDGLADWAMAAVALNPSTVLSDVTLTVTGPTNVLATSNIVYAIAVTNLGSSTATNVVVSDVLPAGMTFVSATGGGTNHGGVVTWPTVPSFGVGATTNYTITLRAPASGTWTNLAYSTSTTADPDPSNNNGAGAANQVVTAVTPVADLATTVTGPGSVLTNATFSYTITVTNAGPSPASSVVVSDALPAGTTFVSATGGGTHDAGVVTWALPSLAAGATTNFTLSVIAPVIGNLTNTVSSSAASVDFEPANNDGSAVTATVVTGVYPFLLLSSQQLTGGGFRFEFQTYPDTLVSILASTNLVNWIELLQTNSGEGRVIFTDPAAATFPQRFYRTQQ